LFDETTVGSILNFQPVFPTKMENWITRRANHTLLKFNSEFTPESYFKAPNAKIYCFFFPSFFSGEQLNFRGVFFKDAML